ncbi:MAG: folylpolyglutamate synthase/dihydrofolate synthase family protein [Microbacteriaceae bacterium]
MEYQDAADRVIDALMARVGEAAPQPRLEATRRAVDLLGDPQRAFSVVHVTGTNGKTSTSRMIESILRAYGLRTGLMTSPHLRRLNERIALDGTPVSNAQLVENWNDIQPYLLMVDAELTANGDVPLTYFEALTVLAFAIFADAPVDVAVIEVGMGGQWDSTNVADGQVAVFTPIALDHTRRLGNTITEIAKTKAGIIKPAASVVSALQLPEALTELRLAAELNEATLTVDTTGFALESNTMAVGGQVITVRGRAARYEDLFLPLFGDHQAQNATLAIAAVESFLGNGEQPLDFDTLAEGLATATSPGRMQVIGTAPTVLVDAAHNPHGAAALAGAVTTYFTFDRVVCVIGVLEDKDARGIIEALDPVVDEFIVTQSDSSRALDADDLAAIVVAVAGPDRVRVEPQLATAMDEARGYASETEKGAVLVAGSITLVADVIGLAEDERWMP